MESIDFVITMWRMIAYCGLCGRLELGMCVLIVLG